jgi:hypothetical protein
MRRRRFESDPVLFALWQLKTTQSAHDVAAAYCLAMADARVRLPLGALAFGACESLAIPAAAAADRWFKSNFADSIAEGQLLVVARVC